MRIAFIWDWRPDFEQAYQWSDGLAAALVELQKRGHEVRAYADIPLVVPNPMVEITPLHELEKDWPDVFLHWADMTRPHARELWLLGKPMAICFAGGEAQSYNTELFDHIFVESKVYQQQLPGYSTSIAFGTNTDLFTPLEQNKCFDALFPATFAQWKRHELFAKATAALRACAVGYMYDDHEQECWDICVKSGALVLPHVSAKTLQRLYAASRSVVVPSRSDGGSQRTVLEAMSMNVPLVVTDSNKFDYITDEILVAEPTVEDLIEKINQAVTRRVHTHDYVVNNWSHIQYADALETGLKSIL